MLHRESREIVSTGDHLAIHRGETSCRGWDLGRAQRAPNQYCITCANVPVVFWSVVVVIVCSVSVSGTVGKGWAVRGWCWDGFGIVETCWEIGLFGRFVTRRSCRESRRPVASGEGAAAVVVNAENLCMKQYPGGLRSCNTALITSGEGSKDHGRRRQRKVAQPAGTC